MSLSNRCPEPPALLVGCPGTPESSQLPLHRDKETRQSATGDGVGLGDCRAGSLSSQSCHLDSPDAMGPSLRPQGQQAWGSVCEAALHPCPLRTLLQPSRLPVPYLSWSAVFLPAHHFYGEKEMQWEKSALLPLTRPPCLGLSGTEMCIQCKLRTTWTLQMSKSQFTPDPLFFFCSNFK